jgi:hypothetical protein
MLPLSNGYILDVSSDMWQMKHDVVSLGPLRLTVQRIAYSHWSPHETLRSWGQVPLHKESDVLLAPCAPAEALWLGVWLEEGEGPASITLIDPISGYRGLATIPIDFQIGVLHRTGAPDLPITLPTGNSYNLRLELVCIEKQAVVPFLLLSPMEWSGRAGRDVPRPLDKPPPLPPLLG